MDKSSLGLYVQTYLLTLHAADDNAGCVFGNHLIVVQHLKFCQNRLAKGGSKTWEEASIGEQSEAPTFAGILAHV